MEICIIGAGAYGCYTANLLANKYPGHKITLFDTGNEKLKIENEAGYLSIVEGNYSGLQKGRFFGLGGTTRKWGGQLLMFSKNDFENPPKYLREIVSLNEKYKQTVLSRFSLKNDETEKRISSGLFTKTGLWLGYFSRDLFKFFKISKKTNIQIKQNTRITKINAYDKNVINIEYTENGVSKKANYDFYFLTAGAFESARILLNSQLIKRNKLPFSDHLSKRVFKIKNGPIIGDIDFSFRIIGTSLITKRMVGELDGASFFIHPIYNSEFTFFQNIKKILYQKQFDLTILKEILFDIPSLYKFLYAILIKKKLYIYKNEWYFQIDLENPVDSGYITLSKEKDKFGEPGINIGFEVGENANFVFSKVKEKLRKLLESNNIEYEEFDDSIHTEKFEDTYHPFGIMADFKDINEYFNFFQNMLIVNTGILPRAGGINSTAAVFPIIEEYIHSYMNINKN